MMIENEEIGIFIEHPINSTIKISEKQYKVVPAEDTCKNICMNCALYDENIVKRCKRCADYKCSKFDRTDKTDVFYEQVKIKSRGN